MLSWIRTVACGLVLVSLVRPAVGRTSVHAIGFASHALSVPAVGAQFPVSLLSPKIPSCITKIIAIDKQLPWESDPTITEIVSQLDRDREMIIAIYGGLGTLTPRFLAPAYRDLVALFPKVKFVVVDTLDPDGGDFKVIQERMTQAGLPWYGGDPQPGLNYFCNKRDLFRRRGRFDALVDQTFRKADQTITIAGRTLRIHGVITAVPTYLHLDIAKRWAAKGAWVWADKPITMINQIQTLQALHETHGNIYGVDFFMDSDALIWLLRKNWLKDIGNILSVSGRCIEPWSILKEKGRGPWLMMPWLGGGGLGIDQAVHPSVMFLWVLNRLGIDTDAIQADHVHFGRSLDPKTGKPAPGMPEDYFYFKGHVPSSHGSIKVLVDNGKVEGVEDYFYGFTVVGERGKIEVSVGTEVTDPYVKFTPIVDGKESDSTLITFSKGGLGYTRTFLDYLLAMYGSPHSSGASVAERFKATTGSVSLVGKGYAKAPWRYRILLRSFIRLLPNRLITNLVRSFGHRFPGYAFGTLPEVPVKVPPVTQPREVPRQGIPFFLKDDPTWKARAAAA